MKLLALLALGYVAIVALLYFAQTWLVFPGATLPSRPIESPLAHERLRLATGDGERIEGVLFPARAPGADLLIGFGGNAQDAEFLAHDLADDFPDLNVAVFHYRGYGPSSGRPSERAVLADALTIHDALSARLEPPRTFAIGISLGSSVAAYLSKHRPLAGVILVTPFDSVEAIARETYFWVPLRWLLKHRFPTVEFVADNRTPMAVLAAEHDRIVRPRRTDALVERIPNLVYHKRVDGAEHNTIAEVPIYEPTLLEAFAALRGAVAAGGQAAAR